MSVVHLLIAAVVGCLLTATAGYWVGHESGRKDVQSRWDAEKVRAYAAAEVARKRVTQIEQEAEIEVRRLSDAYSKEVARRDAALSASHRELDRLRHAIAAADRNRLPKPAACRPEADGAASVAGDLLSACAGELVEMGEQAERLAGQVISLQDYIRIIRGAH